WNHSSLDDVPESELLRKTTAAALNPEAEPVPYMDFNDAYIRQYPPELRQRIAIIAANYNIVNREYIAPLKIFDSLKQDEVDEPIKEYVQFLRAKIAAEVGRINDAKRLWQELADQIEDRQFRARAQYALTLLKLQEGEITPQGAIDELEKLRIVWRGDDLERSLLTVLGQLYVNQGNYWDGMKAWEELLQYYPNTQEAIEAYKRMSETFRYLFLNNGSKDMKPLKALALYNEFQELTPLGDEGNKMIQNLVDELVKVDLLEQAAARLENQIEYRLKGEEKSLIGARLALIYLLNREPTNALLALQKSREANVPGSLSLQRNRLAAQALLDLKRPEQSLMMIEGDYSPEGEAIRLEAYWAKEDWANVIDIIELMFRARPDLNAPFSVEEGQRLLQLTLAYQFLGEYNQMAYLRDAYGPLMKGNPLEDEFLFIARDKTPVDYQNFEKAVENINNIQSFMDRFKNQVKDDALSNAIEEPAADDNSAPIAEPETGELAGPQ
ncbi:MAG: tetratricopeptide repeat protein, partial [Rickettsiales bacterium]